MKRKQIVQTGTVKEFCIWLDKITSKYKSDLIPYSWVPDYVGISRASVHKAAAKGNITTFSFIINDNYKSLSGELKKPHMENHKYALLSECRIWKQKIDRWKNNKNRN
jgi:hypothetical protein